MAHAAEVRVNQASSAHFFPAALTRAAFFAVTAETPKKSEDFKYKITVGVTRLNPRDEGIARQQERLNNVFNQLSKVSAAELPVSDWKEYSVQHNGIHPLVEEAAYQEALSRGENPLRLHESSFASDRPVALGTVFKRGARAWRVIQANHPFYKARRDFASE